MRLDCDGSPTLLFCENETNTQRLYGEGRGFFKDGINDHVVAGKADAINPARTGTKAAIHHTFRIEGHGRAILRLRLRPAEREADAFADFDAVIAARRTECDVFYDALQAGIDGEDARRVQRQAFAGMLWSKQYYGFDVREWLNGDPNEPRPPHERLLGRDSIGRISYASDILSMPDAWEYPWFASWISRSIA